MSELQKTIDEILTRHVKVSGHAPRDYTISAQEFNLLLEHIAQNEWIKCADNKPESGKEVLVYLKHCADVIPVFSTIFQSEDDGVEGFYYADDDTSFYEIDEVSHWRTPECLEPLPEPPSKNVEGK